MSCGVSSLDASSLPSTAIPTNLTNPSATVPLAGISSLSPSVGATMDHPSGFMPNRCTEDGDGAGDTPSRAQDGTPIVVQVELCPTSTVDDVLKQLERKNVTLTIDTACVVSTPGDAERLTALPSGSTGTGWIFSVFVKADDMVKAAMLHFRWVIYLVISWKSGGRRAFRYLSDRVRGQMRTRRGGLLGRQHVGTESNHRLRREHDESQV